MKFVKMFCSIYTTIVLLAIYAILCAAGYDLPHNII